MGSNRKRKIRKQRQKEEDKKGRTQVALGNEISESRDAKFALHQKTNSRVNSHYEFESIKIVQLNMRRSAIVTGEVRRLATQKHFDILLLQEPYTRRNGTNGAFHFGLGVSTKIAVDRTERPWAIVASTNPSIQLLIISQLTSAQHIVCVH